MKTGYVISGILVLALVLVLAFSAGGKTTDSGTISGNAVSGGGDSQVANDEVDVTFDISGKNFRFFMGDVESPELKVKQGDRVRIVFNNEEGFHDWVVDEFDAKTRQISAESSDTIEFAADKKGTYEYYCSVGEHRGNGMFGKFIVE